MPTFAEACPMHSPDYNEIVNELSLTDPPRWLKNAQVRLSSLRKENMTL